MKKTVNIICAGLGFLFFGIGAAGAVVPVIPTTPFLLAATFFFARGSERFHRWFVSTNLYRRYIEQAVKNKAIILIVALAHFYYFLFKVRGI